MGGHQGETMAATVHHRHQIVWKVTSLRPCEPGLESRKRGHDLLVKKERYGRPQDRGHPAYPLQGSGGFWSIEVTETLDPALWTGSSEEQRMGTKLTPKSPLPYPKKAYINRDPSVACDSFIVPGCITTGRDWESHRAAHNWPSVVQVRVWPG